MLARVVLAALLTLFAAAPALADRAIIVLDASGSMWGQIDGRPKLEIARETLRTVLSTASPDLELGLMAYGHREKGNCSDIQLLVPPAAGNAGAIASAADQLQFLGKTPLTEATRLAAEQLRYTEEKATVILITDGVETCEADPCALGRQLEQTGVDLTVHVVGFGLSRDEGRQVACLAEETGGKYLEAKNAGELATALNQAVATAAAETPPQPLQPVSLPPATIGFSNQQPLTIGSSLAVNWTGPSAPNDYLDIVPAGYSETNGELAYAYVSQGSPIQINLPGTPGNYELRYVWDGPDKRHVLAKVPLTVVDSDVALIAPATAMAGTMMTVEWKGPDSGTDYIDIVPPGFDDTINELSYAYTANGNPAQLKAPGNAGRYEMRYVLAAPDGRKVLIRVPLEVTPATASVAFPQQVSGGTVLNIAWTGPVAQGDYLDIVPITQSSVGGEMAYFYVQNSPDGETAEMVAPARPGSYQVRYILAAPDGAKAIASQPLDVTPPVSSLRATDVVEGATAFGVDFTGPNGPLDYVDIVPEGYTQIGGELGYFYTRNFSDPQGAGRGEITAPENPGRYVVRYISAAAGGSVAISQIPIEVR